MVHRVAQPRHVEGYRRAGVEGDGEHLVGAGPRRLQLVGAATGLLDGTDSVPSLANGSVEVEASMGNGPVRLWRQPSALAGDARSADGCSTAPLDRSSRGQASP